MKTLFIYYCSDSQIGKICAESADSKYVDVIEISPRYSCGFTRKLSRALSGEGVRIKENNIDFSKYDSVIVASTLIGGVPSPVVNEFLHTTNLYGVEVTGVLIKGSFFSRHTAEVFRKRIALAGGNCRSVVTIPAKEIKKNHSNVMEYVKNAVIKAESF